MARNSSGFAGPDGFCAGVIECQIYCRHRSSGARPHCQKRHRRARLRHRPPAAVLADKFECHVVGGAANIQVTYSSRRSYRPGRPTNACAGALTQITVLFLVKLFLSDSSSDRPLMTGFIPVLGILFLRKRPRRESGLLLFYAVGGVNKSRCESGLIVGRPPTALYSSYDPRGFRPSPGQM